MDPDDSRGGEAEVLALSVRDFVAPLERSGSLEAGSSGHHEEDPHSQGIRLHGRTQKRLQKEDPGVQAEVPVQALLTRPGFACRVRGRLDVLYPGPPPRVEEIKTGFRTEAMVRDGADPGHPFALQALMYAWLRHRETGELPLCRLRIISLLDESETLVDLDFDPGAFSLWVEGRLAALHGAFLRARARAEERRALGARLVFPFPQPRPGQGELVAQVAEALEGGRRLLIQAPTGLGKTAALLYPALVRALDRDQRVFYCTPRNSQHEVAEACIARMRAQGEEVRSVTIRSKARMCTQPDVDCRPEACPRAHLYYDRLKASGVLEALGELGCATSAAVALEADRHLLCPYELSLDAALGADVVIGDYNYVFSPDASLGRFFGTPEAAARNIVLVDEAHNLPARAAEWFSPALETAWLEDLARRRFKAPRRGLKARITAQIRRCQAVLDTFQGPHRRLEGLDTQPFHGEEHRIGRLLAAAGPDLPPSHPLVALFQGWSAFCGVLRILGDEHGITWQPPGKLQITCADAAAHLALRMAGVANAVLFSGTLKPFEFQLRLAGLGGLETRCLEVASPFPPEHRKVLVVPQISTLYRLRDREVPRIAHFLHRVLPLRHGNYFIFFPSYEMLDRTLPHLDLPGFRVLAQPRRATQAQVEEILQALRTERGLVVLAVQGGSLSEGIDCPGEALIGCVVVGPPLPRFDLEREHIRNHFQKAYGLGLQYAYTYPAIAKAVQAAGRVIRTPQDKGLLIFLDGRFLEEDFVSGFPSEWYLESPREWVSRGILGEVEAFWKAPRDAALGGAAGGR